MSFRDAKQAAAASASSAWSAELPRLDPTKLVEPARLHRAPLDGSTRTGELVADDDELGTIMDSSLNSPQWQVAVVEAADSVDDEESADVLEEEADSGL